MDAHTPKLILCVGRCALNVSRSLDVTASANGMLIVILNIEIDANQPEGVGQAGYRTVATALELVLGAINRNDVLKDSPEVSCALGFARLRGRR